MENVIECFRPASHMWTGSLSRRARRLTQHSRETFPASAGESIQTWLELFRHVGGNVAYMTSGNQTGTPTGHVLSCPAVQRMSV